MPIETLGKKRESLMFQSEEYKKIVREYLESEGYASRTDSYHEGQLPDLILTHISEPSGELWVECKATTISPSHNKLKEELLSYLIEITQRKKSKVMVRVYATGIASQREFKKILTRKHGPELIPEWLSKTVSEMKPDKQEILHNLGQDKIIDFFLNVDIKIAEPEWLMRVTAERKRKNRLSTDRYVEDLHARSRRLSEPIKKPVELVTSMLKLQHPNQIFRAITPKYKSKKKIYSYFESLNANAPPFTFFPDKQQISTFCKFDRKNPLTKIIDKNTIDKKTINKGEVSQQNIHSILNIHLRRIFWKKGLLRVPDKYIYYFPPDEEEGQFINKEVEGVPGKKKTIVHVYRRDSGKLDHVFHHAIEMLPQRLWGKTFLKIRPTKVFSDGKILFTGQRKRSIEHKYRNSIFNRNPAQLLETTFWQSFISRTDNYEKGKEYWFDDIKLGKLLTTTSPYSPRIQVDTDQRKLGEFKDENKGSS